MLKIVSAILAISLASCVSAQYGPSPDRVPDMSAYNANRACLAPVLQTGREYPAPPALGLLPALAALSTPAGQIHQAAMRATEEACMASHGWQRR